MAKLKRKEIQQQARAVLEGSPGGVRWGELLKTIHGSHPETPQNSIQGAVLAMLQASDDVVKVARGTYQLKSFAEADAAPARKADELESATPVAVDGDDPTTTPLIEQHFYSSFAEWLVYNDEATHADALGGSGLGGKWGTPDVLGVLKPRAQDIFRFEPQIIAAEIKATPTQPVVAFGQAVAYRLFAHKSYIVVPRTTSGDDMSRLKSLCSIHGVGLVVFELDKSLPDYNVIVRPVLASPDMFYVNGMLERLKSTEPKLLNRLFS